MRVLGTLRLSFWIGVAGVIVLYWFFVAIAGISPAQVASLTAVVLALTVAFTLRNLRVASELADRGGDPRLRRTLNKARERRGF